MKYVALPEEKVRRLSFYLAMEEYVARHVDEDDTFFMWQVEPSVIFGRNQLIENEVNLDYCRTNQIATFRRKSGGGCVYADMKNIMFSYITKEDNVSLTFSRYINMVVEVLRRLGVDARASGRNDIRVYKACASTSPCSKTICRFPLMNSKTLCAIICATVKRYSPRPT